MSANLYEDIDMDHLPQNPAILVSSVNMLLRDAYSAADRSERSEDKTSSTHSKRFAMRSTMSRSR